MGELLVVIKREGLKNFIVLLILSVINIILKGKWL